QRPPAVAPSRAASSPARLRSTPARPRRRGSRCPRAENRRAEYARTLLEPPSPLSPHCVPGFIGRTHVFGLQPLIPEPCTRALYRGVRTPADTGLNEIVDLTVEHRLSVAGLKIGAQIFDHLVGVQHIVADLIPPRGLHIAAKLIELGLLF